MDFAQFLKGLQEMFSIPDGQKLRSTAVAKRLNDADRMEFFRHLKDMNMQLEDVEKQETGFLNGMEEAVMHAERAVAHFERTDEEEASHERDMQTAERNLSSPS